MIIYLFFIIHMLVFVSIHNAKVSVHILLIFKTDERTDIPRCTLINKTNPNPVYRVAAGNPFVYEIKMCLYVYCSIRIIVFYLYGAISIALYCKLK